MLKIDGISPQFCLDANYGEPFPGPCPATYSKLSRRESNPMPMSPYWSLFNSSGSIKLMNANMGSDSGCLLVPASASGVVKLGSCSSAAAAGWSVALDSGEQSTAESSKAAPTSGGRTNVGAIAGGAVGGVLGLIAIGGLVYYFKKRGNRDNNIPVVDRDVGKSASNSYAMDSKAVAAPIMPPSPALDPQVIPDSGSFYDVGLKSAKSGTPLPTSQPIGTGSPLYFDNGGDLAAGVTAVEVRKFAVATRSWTPGAADELGLSVGGVFLRFGWLSSRGDCSHVLPCSACSRRPNLRQQSIQRRLGAWHAQLRRCRRLVPSRLHRLCKRSKRVGTADVAFLCWISGSAELKTLEESLIFEASFCLKELRSVYV